MVCVKLGLTQLSKLYKALTAMEGTNIQAVPRRSMAEPQEMHSSDHRADCTKGEAMVEPKSAPASEHPPVVLPGIVFFYRE